MQSNSFFVPFEGFRQLNKLLVFIKLFLCRHFYAQF